MDNQNLKPNCKCFEYEKNEGFYFKYEVYVDQNTGNVLCIKFIFGRSKIERSLTIENIISLSDNLTAFVDMLKESSQNELLEEFMSSLNDNMKALTSVKKFIVENNESNEVVTLCLDANGNIIYIYKSRYSRNNLLLIPFDTGFGKEVSNFVKRYLKDNKLEDYEKFVGLLSCEALVLYFKRSYLPE